MSGNEGIGFGPSFSELLLETALKTLWASPATSSLLKAYNKNILKQQSTTWGVCFIDHETNVP